MPQIQGSSNLDSIYFSGEGEEGTLVVRFKKGSVYRYNHVGREIYESLIATNAAGESVGSLFRSSVVSGGFDYSDITDEWVETEENDRITLMPE